MNVNERTGRKAGRDLAGIGVGTLAAASLGEYVALGTYTSLLVAAVANVVLLAGYRWLRDRGVLMPEDDGPPIDSKLEAGLDEMFRKRVLAAIAASYPLQERHPLTPGEPTIGGNV